MAVRRSWWCALWMLVGAHRRPSIMVVLFVEGGPSWPFVGTCQSSRGGYSWPIIRGRGGPSSPCIDGGAGHPWTLVGGRCCFLIVVVQVVRGHDV